MNPTKKSDEKTNPTHTPGPWRIGRDGLIIAMANVEVAKPLPTVPYPPDGQTAKEKRANARLIATAPDLLEALRACCGWFHGDSQNGVAIKARAAIAKAEGEVL